MMNRFAGKGLAGFPVSGPCGQRTLTSGLRIFPHPVGRTSPLPVTDPVNALGNWPTREPALWHACCSNKLGMAMHTLFDPQPPAAVRHRAQPSLDPGDIIPWLETPTAYGATTDTVERIDTHSMRSTLRRRGRFGACRWGTAS